MLSLAREPIITEGLTYDLCYCCKAEEGFNPDRHFAFLRALGGKIILVVCNFGQSDSDMTVTIPREAFSYLGIQVDTVMQQVRVPAGDATVLDLFF